MPSVVSSWYVTDSILPIDEAPFLKRTRRSSWVPLGLIVKLKILTIVDGIKCHEKGVLKKGAKRVLETVPESVEHTEVAINVPNLIVIIALTVLTGV